MKDEPKTTEGAAARNAWYDDVKAAVLRSWEGRAKGTPDWINDPKGLAAALPDLVRREQMERAVLIAAEPEERVHREVEDLRARVAELEAAQPLAASVEGLTDAQIRECVHTFQHTPSSTDPLADWRATIAHAFSLLARPASPSPLSDEQVDELCEVMCHAIEDNASDADTVRRILARAATMQGGAKMPVDVHLVTFQRPAAKATAPAKPDARTLEHLSRCVATLRAIADGRVPERFTAATMAKKVADDVELGRDPLHEEPRFVDGAPPAARELEAERGDWSEAQIEALLVALHSTLTMSKGDMRAHVRSALRAAGIVPNAKAPLPAPPTTEAGR